MSLLKLLKRRALRSMRGDWEESNKMAEELNLGLPNSTTEREIIEHYFRRGYEYKSIVLLAKYHDIRLSERTLKRKLKDFGLKRLDI